MTSLADSTLRVAELRQRAAARLHGAAAAPADAAHGAAALEVLHALASTPATASDALALLHELQVHQVEVDLQAEELRESRAVAEAALRRQVAIYDALPVACLTIDAEFVVQEINRAGVRLLGVVPGDASPIRIDRHLDADSALALREAFTALTPEVEALPLALRLETTAGTAREVHTELRAEPGSARALLVMVDLGGRSLSHRPA